VQESTVLDRGTLESVRTACRSEDGVQQSQGKEA
jgi:hypothetical protein